MSPARQTKGSSGKRKVVRQTTIHPNIRAERNAVDSSKKKRDFDPAAFLATIGEGRKFVFFPSKETLFAQGDPADAVFYIQTGKVRLTVVQRPARKQPSAY
jgi:CRP-like cAMP-binding protein